MVVEEGTKSFLGSRLIAVCSIFFLGLALVLMSFVLLPQVPLAPHGGVVRVALATAEGVREHWMVVAAAFLVLGAATGLGYADRLLKPISVISLAVLVFFAIAAWWTIRTVPGAPLPLGCAPALSSRL